MAANGYTVAHGVAAVQAVNQEKDAGEGSNREAGSDGASDGFEQRGETEPSRAASHLAALTNKRAGRAAEG